MKSWTCILTKLLGFNPHVPSLSLQNKERDSDWEKEREWYRRWTNGNNYQRTLNEGHIR
ncbi:hypothetical protein Hdeb2414_s0023g00628211 [Helianthus debilis subsp. tardiflorus]